MIFNEHYRLAGQHARLSASKHHWLNYDDDKMVEYFRKLESAARGTRLHAFAKEAIELGIKMRDNNQTINRYVNDAISYRMVPEQLLYHSENAFGTPDAISYRERADGMRFLRISDLKTGDSHTSVNQLLVYAAFFFLEYGEALGITPNDVTTELRIYQSNEVREYLADPEEVMWVMARVIHADNIIRREKEATR